jgi:hypothetical protein
MKKLIIQSLIAILLVVFFTEIDAACVKLGISWTLSKIIPYVLLLTIGTIMTFEINSIHFKNAFYKVIAILFGFSLPFAIGFYLHPIYEGDFSNNSEAIKKNLSPSDFTGTGLTVLTIPGCNFCFETIAILKKIKKNNPKLKIDFVVCTTSKNNTKTYSKEIGGAFAVKLAKQPDQLAAMANFSFPAFIYVEKNSPLTIWNNNSFGVRVFDELKRKTTN